MRISDWSSDVCSSDLRRRDHVAGDVDAADQRESTQDPALAGAGQRVLEIDGRVRASDHDLAGRQVVQRDPLDATAVAGLVAVDAEGLEGFRDRHGPASRGGKGAPLIPVNAEAFTRGRSGPAVAVAAPASGHNPPHFAIPPQPPPTP